MLIDGDDGYKLLKGFQKCDVVDDLDNCPQIRKLSTTIRLKVVFSFGRNYVVEQKLKFSSGTTSKKV